MWQYKNNKKTVRLTNKTCRRSLKISQTQHKTSHQQQMMECFSTEKWKKRKRKRYS